MINNRVKRSLVESNLGLDDDLSLHLPPLLDHFCYCVLLLTLLGFLVTQHLELVLALDLCASFDLSLLDLELLKSIVEQSSSVIEAFNEVSGMLLTFKLFCFFEVLTQFDETCGKGLDGCGFIIVALFFGVNPYLFGFLKVLSQPDSLIVNDLILLLSLLFSHFHLSEISYTYYLSLLR